MTVLFASEHDAVEAIYCVLQATFAGLLGEFGGTSSPQFISEIFQKNVSLKWNVVNVV